MSIVFLNGKYLALEEAKIPVLDRGFIFGDGVYEVIPVYNQHIFRLKEHIQRLENSLNEIFVKTPYSYQEWEEILTQLVQKNDGEMQSIYLQITRGVSERIHAIDPKIKPTVFAMSKPLNKPDFSNGIAAISYEDIRWQYCHIKAIALLPSILLRHQAYQVGADEAILLRKGYLTEGAASNVFIVKDNSVLTPPKSRLLLSGITRDLVIELIQQAGIACHEQAIPEKDLRNAEEIWVSSSTWEIAPIVQLDGKPVASGTPGAMWKQVDKIYQDYKEQLRLGNI